MSRILRRPMFRGGRVDSRGTGITSGLGYAKGGQIGGGSIAGKAYPDGRYGFENPRFINLGGGSAKTGQSVMDAATSKWGRAKNLVTSPKFSERGLYEAVKKYGPKALNWGKGLGLGIMSRFPLLTVGAGLYGAATPTPVDEKYGISRMDNLFPFMDSEFEGSALEKKLKRNQEEASNPNNPWRYDEGLTGIPRKEHPLYDPEKSSWWPWGEGAAEEVEVTGVDFPPGGGRTRLGTGEDFYEAPEPPKEKSTEELLKELMGKKKTAKEKVAEFKEVFEDAYGSGVPEDASRMLMSFAGKALKPGADTKSAFGEFFEEESKVEGKRSKYKDAATTAAINAFLTGEKDYQTLMNQMTLIDHQLKKKEDYATAKKTIDNLLSAYASSAKDDRTDPGVMQAAYNDLYQKQIFEGPVPENKDGTVKEDELIVGKIYYQDHPTDSRNKIIFLVKADGSLKQINTILK